MPDPGFKTITVPEAWFDRFDKIYHWHKKNGMLHPGICSFASFFAEQLGVAEREKNSMSKFVKEILYVPDKFTETKLVLKKTKL